MSNLIKKLRDEKKEYRIQMARVKALPKDYQFVYKKMQDYMWSFSGGTGLDMLKTQYELINLFESGAAEEVHVLDVTGDDVASFCEELMSGNTLWMDRIRKRLNNKLNKHLQ